MNGLKSSGGGGDGRHLQGISPYLFWLDLETTGLDDRNDKILEIFVLVTDRDLNAIDSLELVVHYSDEELEAMNLSSWVLRQHATLLQLVKHSSTNLREAEQQLKDFFIKHCDGKQAILAGSSVYFDRSVLKSQMPLVMPHIHHRLVDVSTLMELARRWMPHLHRFAPLKNQSHRAREDVYSSLNLLSFYRTTFFQPPWQTYPTTSRPPSLHSVYL